MILPMCNVSPVTPSFIKSVTDPETNVTIAIYSPAQGLWKPRDTGGEVIQHKPSFIYSVLVHHAEYWEKKLQTNLTPFMQEVAESQLALHKQELEHEQWDLLHKYDLRHMH
ncbi:hypothetical protein NVP2275O_122 [Vibrio phage 2.275.O._10N.286.54.E11]|nr:hypothetical protein NVP2275O_122 [Vibrio phage 2.275.O._10N.286.54.E11]